MSQAKLTKNSEKYRQIEELVAVGTPIADIIRIAHTDFYTLKKYFPTAGRPDLRGGRQRALPQANPERFRKIGLLVAQNASLNDIMRSTGADHRTIKKYFPNAGWRTGGAGDAAVVRSTNERLARGL